MIVIVDHEVDFFSVLIAVEGKEGRREDLLCFVVHAGGVLVDEGLERGG